ncbi:MAG TPA: AraC family transcriptional regulator [Gemmatimonadaceae bacterium]|nr:AraC family transcriptional regulator [Gemmatimonadaceae bacterium]
MDPLSDVLRAVRLDGAYFYLVEAGAPWSVAATASPDLVPRVLPGSEHLIPYHILTSGACWAGVTGESQVRMQPGDAILFPQGDAHVLSSAEQCTTDRAPMAPMPPRPQDTLQLGPDSARDTTFVCGFLGVDVRPFNPLLAALPRRLHVPGIAGGWLSRFPQQVVEESRSGRVGSGTLLTRLAELMFLEVLRHHYEHLGTQQTGWLAGLKDPVVGPALMLLHDRPAQQWTIAEVAQQVGTSRTVLAERFTQLVGVPLMLYLTRWRLQLAAELLRQGSTKVASVAARVGYESEASFSRAFKRETGSSPAAWRAARR